MLRLLLDEHLSPDLGEGLCRANKSIVVHWLAEWEGGRGMGRADDFLLREAMAQGLTLVTYDRKTIPPLLKTWAEAGRDHGGIIFVDEKTIPSSDIGGLIRALQKIFKETARWNWTNRICFLRR
ncbi:MAG TPA: hypothetical protein VGR14_08660 [Verrucomicrobiae bacterium]|jgi:hypothetical protein|nr:hypothetical protein [Verrucomicrobiae bacterium]